MRKVIEQKNTVGESRKKDKIMEGSKQSKQKLIHVIKKTERRH